MEMAIVKDISFSETLIFPQTLILSLTLVKKKKLKNLFQINIELLIVWLPDTDSIIFLSVSTYHSLVPQLYYKHNIYYYYVGGSTVVQWLAL